jgi:hypothetical protein
MQGAEVHYDWDGARTRRMIMLKMALAALATATVVLLPAALLWKLA